MPIVVDVKNEDGEWQTEFYKNGTKFITKSCQTWRGVLDRCKVGGLQQKRFSNYIGCTVSNLFKEFQFFAEWCNHQIGYGLENYHIDKDILIPGNKHYNYDRCVFVPAALNTFFTDSSAIRGNLPQGVSLSSCGKYKVAIAKDEKVHHLGVCGTVQAAAKLYRDEKKKLCKQWAKRCEDREFVVDPRVILALHNWKLEN